MAIRLYLSALTLVFFILVWMARGVGGIAPLEAIVVLCALVYLILDTREYLQVVKAELDILQQLEAKLSTLLR